MSGTGRRNDIRGPCAHAQGYIEAMIAAPMRPGKRRGYPPRSMLEEIPDGRVIAFESKSGDDGDARRRGQRRVAKAFAFIDV